MGKKPVIAWAGMILATLSLAGCKCCGSKGCSSCADGSCSTPNMVANQPIYPQPQPAPANVGQPLPQGPVSAGNWNNTNRGTTNQVGNPRVIDQRNPVQPVSYQTAPGQVRPIDNSERAYGTTNNLPNPTTVNGAPPATTQPTGVQQVNYVPAAAGVTSGRPNYQAPAPVVHQAPPAPNWNDVPAPRRPLPSVPVEEGAIPAAPLPSQPAASSSPLRSHETTYHEAAPVVEPQLPELPPAN